MQKWQTLVVTANPTIGTFVFTPMGLLDFEWAKTELESKWEHDDEGFEYVTKVPKSKRAQSMIRIFEYLSDEGWEPVSFDSSVPRVPEILFKRPIEDG